jgi:16S rRNA (cytosine967-C5)-methyltransferase
MLIFANIAKSICYKLTMQNRFNTYFLVAKNLIELYKGEMPLAIYLKNYFSQNKKHGSTDRKQIAHWCYCYYRLGNALQQIAIEERMPIAYYLCNHQPGNYTFLFNESYLNNWSENVEERIQFIQQQQSNFSVEKIFESIDNIALQIDKTAFVKNYLQQPNLFLRIRPSYDKAVKEKLKSSSINFEELNNNCLSLQNGSNVENAIILNKEAVVQDYNSQQIASLIKLVKTNFQQPISVWDCCAASGGKSILAIDTLKNINLTVSDIRASIIANLKARFAIAGIKKYEAFVADISQPIELKNKFNFIICDAPCTGSGTWARTPEELFYFKQTSIQKFALLQQQIAINAIQYLQDKGYFLYITCSVFTQENDEIVDIILQQKNIELVEKKYFVGYNKNADTMFAALFYKTAM